MTFNIYDKYGKVCFELNGIQMVFDGYTESHGLHFIENPEKAIAYFNIKNEIYSVSNQLSLYKTAEEFYEAMKSQISFFKR